MLCASFGACGKWRVAIARLLQKKAPKRGYAIRGRVREVLALPFGQNLSDSIAVPILLWLRCHSGSEKFEIEKNGQILAKND